MSITTYAELKTEIENWVDDASITSYVADFVSLAEKRIKRKVRLREMVARSTAAMPTSDRYLALPSDFVAVKQVQLNTTDLRTLEYVPEDTINLHYTSTAGEPFYYTITGTEFQFEKIPDSAYTVEITYYQLSALSDSNTTNEIFPEFSELYLHASLVQAFLFVDETDRADYHEKLYKMYLKEAIEHDEMAKSTEGSLVRRADVIE